MGHMKVPKYRKKGDTMKVSRVLKKRDEHMKAHEKKYDSHVSK
jgi:hypothetical protein